MKQSFLQSVFLLASTGSAQLGGLASNSTGSNGTKIHWGTCIDSLAKNATTGFQCANLSVPLDYKDTKSNKSLRLNLLRYPAPKQPSKGSVLFNPGGPGYGGRNTMVLLAPLLALYTGGGYDIVTWDPRGTGTTIPAVCFSNDTQRQAVLNSIPYVDGSDASIQKAYNVFTPLTSLCKSALKENGELIGSVYTARDMGQIVDALGEDGLLRYYGTSYGTALGQIFAAIFPNKVDKMVLDGVLNPHQYITSTDYQQVAATEAVRQSFLSSCQERPDLCVLAKRDISEKNLDQQVETLFQQILKDNGYDYGTAKLSVYQFNIIFISALYSSALWPSLGAFLNALLEDNKATVAKYVALLGTSLPPQTPFRDEANVETIPAIRCSDTSLVSKGEAAALPIGKKFAAQSVHFGGFVFSTQSVICAQWPFKAKEVYTGDFDVKTKNPILFVGNVFDPITSLDAARNASATFQGSGLLVEQGWGHTSTADLSNCTINAVSTYFVTGKMPAAGTVCLPDNPLFTDKQVL